MNTRPTSAKLSAALRSQRGRPAHVSTEGVVIPAGIPESFDEHVKLHFDLQRLAFQADITRVSTVLYARDLTSRSYPESGVHDGFHGISHHAENPETIARYAKLNQYHIKCLAYFVDKLKNTPDGDGTLLDHSLILYGSNMGDSNQHLHYDVPYVLVGGASGQMKGDRHLHFASRTVPTGNLLASVLDMYGVHEDQIGDSTGRLFRHGLIPDGEPIRQITPPRDRHVASSRLRMVAPIPRTSKRGNASCVSRLPLEANYLRVARALGACNTALSTS